MEIYLGHSKENNEELRSPLEEVGNVLIAGRSGSGKSTYLHAMLERLLDKHGPESLKILLFDGKRVDFRKLKDDPHLLLPIRQELSEFKNQLIFLDSLLGRREPDDPPILFIVDEFAEVSYRGRHIGKAVERLMRFGPKNGIHLILAAQVEKCFSKKMLSLAETKLSFRLLEGDSLRFIGNKDAVDLPQAEAILIRGNKPETKVEIVYEKYSSI